uniref:Lipoprotein LpqS n=1 Tax=Mycobacterium riyadhense TaxID=486698 RepID=A0A653F409_9MYCO|nr:hypothetical protein BIN_B_05507 [Mycobacterium riyadhense]
MVPGIWSQGFRAAGMYRSGCRAASKSHRSADGLDGGGQRRCARLSTNITWATRSLRAAASGERSLADRSTRVTETSPKLSVRCHWEKAPRGVPSPGMGHIRLWSDVRRVLAGRPPRLPSAVVVAAAVAILAIVGHCGAARTLSAPSNPPRPVLSTSLPAALTFTADQPQLVQGLAICQSSKLFAIAGLPTPAGTALMVIGVGLAVVVGNGWLAQLLVFAGRGPPRAPATALTGQDLLRRICLARR